MSKSPLNTVKAKYGSKAALVEAASKVLSPLAGESTEAFAKRLKLVANAKLLHLVEVAERVKSLGGKEALIAKVADLRRQGKDKDYVAKLSTSTMSTLLDLHSSLNKKNKKA